MRSGYIGFRYVAHERLVQHAGSVTVCCREAAAEATGMYSRRVTESFTRQEALET